MLVFPALCFAFIVVGIISMATSSEPSRRGQSLAMGFYVYFAAIATVAFFIAIIPIRRTLNALTPRHIASFAALSAGLSLAWMWILFLLVGRVLWSVAPSVANGRWTLFAAPFIAVWIATWLSHLFVARRRPQVDPRPA